uniref:TonB C-terminal domain-containing protein n=1 Tax=Roseihalotalea indica TaxID=2867963 RepID=A0AA49GLQ3_9BACT|nr:hypothetical protein K4G66_25370 [Tunicatimonas sp. TK19036]
MKELLITIGILLTPLLGFATGQAGDILIWNGDTLTMFSNPLEYLPNVDSLRTKLFGDKEGGMTTACWRGYIAEWHILDEELYLTNIFSCSYWEDSIKADLAQLFEQEYINDKVKAHWVTGKVLVPKGELIHYIHSGYESIYETELLLSFQRGKLTGQEVFDNAKSFKSVYTENNDSLYQFIGTQINWNKIPDLQNEEVRIFASFTSTEEAKLDSIMLYREADNEVFNEEAIRVVKAIPSWDVYFKFGKIYPVRWTIPIIFSEEARKKYEQ